MGRRGRRPWNADRFLEPPVGYPASVAVDAQAIAIRLRGWYQFLAARRRVRIPLVEVAGASVHEDPLSLVRGLKVLGTTIPGGTQAGTFNQRRGRFWGTDFVAVARNERALVLHLSGKGRFDRVIVEVEEPERAVAEIKRMLATATRSTD